MWHPLRPPSPYHVASLAPQLPYQRPVNRDEVTELVSLKTSAFPYLGNNPRSDSHS